MCGQRPGLWEDGPHQLQNVLGHAANRSHYNSKTNDSSNTEVTSVCKTLQRSPHSTLDNPLAQQGGRHYYGDHFTHKGAKNGQGLSNLPTVHLVNTKSGFKPGQFDTRTPSLKHKQARVRCINSRNNMEHGCFPGFSNVGPGTPSNMPTPSQPPPWFPKQTMQLFSMPHLKKCQRPGLCLLHPTLANPLPKGDVPVY